MKDILSILTVFAHRQGVSEERAKEIVTEIFPRYEGAWPVTLETSRKIVTAVLEAARNDAGTIHRPRRVKIDHAEAVRVATGKIIEYCDPFHSCVPSYWEEMAVDVVNNVFAFGLKEVDD